MVPQGLITRLGIALGAVCLSATAGGAQAQAQDQPDYVLAVSWQPAFCELHPEKPECLTQTEDRFDATNFTLHGLWPGPRGNDYCGVAEEFRDTDKAGDWDALPALTLSPELRAELTEAMPGTASYLHRHEWYKHGTCHEEPNPEDYFQDSLRLLKSLNESEVQDLFETSVGTPLTSNAIQDAFDKAFGDGAGSRVQIACPKDGDRRVIVELKLSLKGPIKDTSLADLIRAGTPQSARCATGLVDAVGLQ